MQCDRCARACADATAVPDRTPSSDPPYGMQFYCVLCLDAFLALSPLSPRDVRERETTGRWRARRSLGSTEPLAMMAAFTMMACENAGGAQVGIG